MAAGSSMGFIADLGEGMLKRIVGQLVAEDKDSVIVAIQGGVLKDLLSLEVGDITVSLAKLKRTDTVTQLSGWEKAIQVLLQAYYRSDMDPWSVDTDSIASAHFPTAPKPGSQTLACVTEHGGEQDEVEGGYTPPTKAPPLEPEGSIYYVVKGGPWPGVYRTWDDARKVSVGQAGALCKKFKDHGAATEFLGGWAKAAGTPAQAEANRSSIVQDDVTDTLGSGDSSGSVFTCDPYRAGTTEEFMDRVAEQTQRSVESCRRRTYLEVPYGEKDVAKAYGAKWDPQRRKWFADSEFDLPALSKWQPCKFGSVEAVHTNPVAWDNASSSSSRTYLEVPYKHKDAAKALGAKWDPGNKKWFADSEDGLRALSAWLPGRDESLGKNSGW